MVKSHRCGEVLDKYSTVEHPGMCRHWIAQDSIRPDVVWLPLDGRIKASMPMHDLKDEPARVRSKQAMVVPGLMGGCDAHQG